jgi:hypothetical protein
VGIHLAIALGMKRLSLALLLCCSASMVCAQAAVGSAAELRARHESLRPQLKENAFQKPLHLVSAETRDGVSGDVFAVISTPFDKAAPPLAQAEGWCEILLLQFNVKQCRVTGNVLDVRIGRTPDQPAGEAFKVAFSYQVATRAGDYLQVRLNADKGPVSTRDYRIILEAAPLPDGRSFVHLFYAYRFGVTGRIAMQAYLGTSGADKVGFTAAGPNGQLVGGMRGVIERNTMRYYIAIESLLGAVDTPPPGRFERAARAFFAGTERYRRQLHEMDEARYLALKRRDYQLQAKS